MPRPATRLRVEPLEPRDTPAAGAGGILAVGADAGGAPEVRLVNPDGTVRTSFLAYDAAFRGGVRVAVGDLTGDGKPEIVTAPGPGGGPLVKVFDGRTGTLVESFFAFDPAFRGGVNVDVGVLGGEPVIATGAGLGGGPEVRVFDGATLARRESFYAYDPAFRGGVTVAVGDVLGDKVGQIVTAPGPGGGPHVKVFAAGTAELKSGFFAYAPTFTGGVGVAVGDVANLGRDAIVTGAGPGGGPQVTVFDAATGRAVQSFFAYATDFRGGVGVAVLRGGAGDRDTLVTGAGVGGGPQVNVYQPRYGYGSGGYGYGGPGYGGFGFPYSYPFASASFFAFPTFFTGGLAFGGGYGVYQPLVPVFDPYFGPGWFYNSYAAPGFLTPAVVSTDQYFTNPTFPTAPAADPGLVAPPAGPPGATGDIGYTDPGFVDYSGPSSYTGDFGGYADPGYGYGYGDFGGDFGGGDF